MGVARPWGWIRPACLLVAVMMLVLIEAPAVAHGADTGERRLRSAGAVTVDSTFGTRGRVLTPISLPLNSRIQAARSSGGKIVAAAGTKIVRYLRDGALDRSFGKRGSIRIRSVEGIALPENASIVGLAVDPQSRVVVVLGGGLVRTTPEGGLEVAGSAILRFTSQGAPDSGFGGDG